MALGRLGGPAQNRGPPTWPSWMRSTAPRPNCQLPVLPPSLLATLPTHKVARCGTATRTAAHSGPQGCHSAAALTKCTHRSRHSLGASYDGPKFVVNLIACSAGSHERHANDARKEGKFPWQLPKEHGVLWSGLGGKLQGEGWKRPVAGFCGEPHEIQPCLLQRQQPSRAPPCLR